MDTLLNLPADTLKPKQRTNTMIVQSKCDQMESQEQNDQQINEQACSEKFNLKVNLKLQIFNSRILAQIQKKKKKLNEAANRALENINQENQQENNDENIKKKKQEQFGQIISKLNRTTKDFNEKIKKTVDKKFVKKYPITQARKQMSLVRNQQNENGFKPTTFSMVPEPVIVQIPRRISLAKVSEDIFLNNTYDLDRFNKESLRKVKKVSLDELYEYLVDAFEYVNKVRDQQCIIAFGNTGCGKSTMFNSLIYGAENMKEKIVQREIEFPDRQGNKKKRLKPFKVVDVDPEKVPTQKAFKIGHNHAKSETFLPNFLFDPSSGNVYVDLAGLNDTNGDLIQLINWIIYKQIFNIVNSFLLIVPITIGQIVDARGYGLHQQVQLLKNICQSKLNKSMNSIFPIVTQCKKVNDDNSKSKLQFVIKSQLNERLKCEDKTMQPSKDQVIIPAAPFKDTIDIAQEYHQEMDKEFYEAFAKKIEIFDPLDRDIKIEPNPDDENPQNQAIRSHELRKLINSTEKIKTQDLKIVIPDNIESYETLKEMFKKKDQMCKKIAKEFLDDARLDQPEYTIQFKKHEEIKKTLTIYKFFSDNKLLLEADSQLKIFELFISKYNQRINDIREQVVLNLKLRGDQEFERAKKLYIDNLHDLEKLILDRSYEGIVQKLIVLSQEFEIYHKRKEQFELRAKEIDLIIKNSEKQMKSLVKDLCNMTKMEEFLKFAYELRKQDRENQFTEQLIKEHVSIPVLFELIMANTWNEVMEFDDSRIQVKILDSDNFVLFHNSQQKANESSLGFTKQCYLKKHQQAYMNLTLTRGCFLIQTLKKTKRLSAVKSVNQYDIKNRIDFQNPYLVEFRDTKDFFYSKHHKNHIENQQWILKPLLDHNDQPIKSDNPQKEALFYIELNYGEQQPRLVNRPGKRLQATMDNNEGQYDGPRWSTFTISIEDKNDLPSTEISDMSIDKKQVIPKKSTRSQIVDNSHQ